MNVEEKIKALKEYIDKKASLEISEILSKAKAQANKIEEKYKEQADSQYEKIVKQAEKNAHEYLMREIAHSKVEASVRIMKARTDILESAMQELTKSVEILTTSDDYPDLLERMTIEAIESLGEKKVNLKFNSRDRELFKKIKKNVELKLNDVVINVSKESVPITGGLIAESENKRLVVKNSLEEKVTEYREKLALSLFEKLDELVR